MTQQQLTEVQALMSRSLSCLADCREALLRLSPLLWELRASIGAFLPATQPDESPSTIPKPDQAQTGAKPAAQAASPATAEPESSSPENSSPSIGEEAAGKASGEPPYLQLYPYCDRYGRPTLITLISGGKSSMVRVCFQCLKMLQDGVMTLQSPYRLRNGALHPKGDTSSPGSAAGSGDDDTAEWTCTDADAADLGGEG